LCCALYISKVFPFAATQPKVKGPTEKENRSQKRKLNNTKEMEVPDMKQVGLALTHENFIPLVGKMEK